jgi:hypothetical protein
LDSQTASRPRTAFLVTPPSRTPEAGAALVADEKSSLHRLGREPPGGHRLAAVLVVV